MKKLFFILFCSCVCFFAGCTSSDGKTGNIDGIFLTDFMEVSIIVNENYSHFDNKNIDPHALTDKYLSQIENCKSREEYIKILFQYFAELENDHSLMFFEQYYGINISLQLIQGRLFIDKIFDDNLRNMLNEKDEIIEIDNLPIEQWIEQNIRYSSGSTEASRIKRTIWSITSGPFQTSRIFLINANNNISKIVIDFAELRTHPLLLAMEPIQSRIINEIAGYLSIKFMFGDISDFVNEYLKVFHLPYLIIDLRENIGGNSDFSEEIASYLIQSYSIASVSGRRIEPNENYYRGTLILLVGPKTASAAESFVLDIKENGNGIIVGSETSGDTGNNPREFVSNLEIIFTIPTRKPPQISSGGFPMEGVGIPPDYFVEMTVHDYQNGIDTVLNFVLENIFKNGI